MSGLIPNDAVGRRILIERITATIVLLIAILLLITSIDYGLFMAGAPGPGLFPAIVAGALGLTSLVWLITGGVVRDEPVGAIDTPVEGEAHRVDAEDLDEIGDVGDYEEGTDQDTGLAHDDTTIDLGGAKQIAFCILWAAIPILLVERLGFIFTVALYVGGMLVVVARTPWWKAFLGALVGGVVTFWLAGLLNIALPRDPFGLFQAMGL